MKTKKTIFVGMSGGVDSSVSAALLQEQGHDVVGVFIKTWQPDWIECTWRDERRDAMRVCAHLDIPFMELDLEKEYKNGVADYMIKEYQEGRTPNPDVMCNKEVKFGGFLPWALDHGADAIATGHYAQNIFNNKTGAYELHKGNDPKKDQSYFLWTLTQEQLPHILFPVGHLPKEKVRKLAEKFSIPTAHKKDSQGICFIGQIDMKDFLSHYITEKRGDVLNEEGDIIGHHNGALFFTIGERRGFIITHKEDHDAPYYVSAKDVDANTITVSHRHESRRSNSEKIMITLRDVMWCKHKRIIHDSYQGVIRYHGQLHSYTLEHYDSATKKARISTHATDQSIACGQSLVLYEGTHFLGGGIIEGVDGTN